MTSLRRSLYLRNAAEKQPEFLQIFDGPAVTECYLRRPSVMPQQALALANSEMVSREADLLARRLVVEAGGNDGRFVELAFARVLGRRPTDAERLESVAYLGARPAGAEPNARIAGNFVKVLFNHNDFVVVR